MLLVSISDTVTLLCTDYTLILISVQKIWTFYLEILRYTFLHKGKPNPNLTQWYICFSLISIQIKVIAQDLGVGGYFWEVDFFTKLYKKRGQCNKCKKLASIRVNNSFTDYLNKGHH